MNFAFIRDPEWFSLSPEIKTKALDFAFEDYTKTEPDWDTLAPEIQSKAKEFFLDDATKFEDSLPKPEQPERTFMGTVGDVGVAAAKGIVGVGQAAVGIADIPGGYAGKMLQETTGYDPEETQNFLETLYSDAQKFADQRVRNARGIVGTTVEALKHPSTIGLSAVESLPSMFGGAAIARGGMGIAAKYIPAVAKSIGAGSLTAPIIASAAGEGAVTAGISAEQIREQTPDGLLTPKQSALAIASGALTGAIAVIGGKLANRIGVPDPDVLLASGKSTVTSNGVIKRIVGGGISEGIFEELPQSVQEQVWLNAALDKPLWEGVPEAGVTGALTGAVMGGGANIFAETAKSDTIKSPADKIASAANADEALAAFKSAINEGIETTSKMTRANPLVEAVEQIGLPASILGQYPEDAVAAINAVTAKKIIEMYPRPELFPGLQIEYTSPQGKTSRGILVAPLEGDQWQARNLDGSDFVANRDRIATPPVLESGREIEYQTKKGTIKGTLIEPLGDTAWRSRRDNGAPFTALIEKITPIPIAGEQFERISSTAPRDEVSASLEAPVPLKEKETGFSGDGAEATLRQVPAEEVRLAVDEAAHEAAISPKNDLLQPTDPQKIAGNAKMGHIPGELIGLPRWKVTVENPKESTRTQAKPKDAPESWKPSWSNEMTAHYGYFVSGKKGLASPLGKDKDNVDVFVGDQPEAMTAFIVDQIDPKTGKFDEHKVVAAVVGKDAAKTLYNSNYAKGWKGLGAITEVSLPQLDAWLGDEKRKTAPVAYGKDEASWQSRKTMGMQFFSAPLSESDNVIIRENPSGKKRFTVYKESDGPKKNIGTFASLEEAKTAGATIIPKRLEPSLPSVVPVEVGATAKAGSKAFVNDNIRQLGTVEAVGAFYTGNDPVSNYARTAAPEILRTETASSPYAAIIADIALRERRLQKNKGFKGTPMYNTWAAAIEREKAKLPPEELKKMAASSTEDSPVPTEVLTDYSDIKPPANELENKRFAALYPGKFTESEMADASKQGFPIGNPPDNIITQPKSKAQNLVTRLVELGKVNWGSDYNAREMRQFTDLARVSSNASRLQPDEAAAMLNDEGYVSPTGQPWDGDSLAEVLKAGQGRNIFTPAKSDAIIEQRLKREEYEWLAKELASIESSKNVAREISADQGHLEEVSLGEIAAETKLTEDELAFASRDAGDFFDALRGERQAKEPWEITQQEHALQTFGSKSRPGEFVYPQDAIPYSAARKPLDTFHKQQVEKALSEGKPVPPEVSKDYPDLQRGTVKAPPPAVKEPWEMTRADLEAMYKKAGEIVDGRTVRSEIPNMESITASVDNPTILPGIYEIPLSEFGGLTGKHYSAPGTKRIANLANAIAHNKEINPLIVVIDAEGPYILEGATRAESLYKLGAKSFPAKIVIDEGSFYEVTKQALSEGKIVPQEVLEDYPDLKQTEATQAVGRALPKKQPWQMTREEFAANQEKDSPYVQQQRDAVVKKAIKEGKQVPPEVLKDYPELLPVAVEEPVTVYHTSDRLYAGQNVKERPFRGSQPVEVQKRELLPAGKRGVLRYDPKLEGADRLSDEMGEPPPHARQPRSHASTLSRVDDKPWEWTAEDLSDIPAKDIEKKLDKIWGPEEDYDAWQEGGGSDLLRHWVATDNAGELERAVRERDTDAIEHLLEDIRSRLKPQDYYAYEQALRETGRASAPAAAQTETPLREVSPAPRKPLVAKPAEDLQSETVSLPGLSPEDTFALSSPKTNIRKHASTPKAPENQSLFEPKGKYETIPRAVGGGIKVLDKSIDDYQRDPQAMIDALVDLMGKETDRTAIVLRGIYKGELGKKKLRRSSVWEDNSPTEKKLGGTSGILVTGDWEYTSLRIIADEIGRNSLKVKKYGDTGYIAVVKGNLLKNEIFNDPGEAVIGNPEVIAYIKKSSLPAPPRSLEAKGPQPQYSLSAPGFYSQLSRVVEAKMSGRMPVDQLRKMLKGNGVTDAEIENVIGGMEGVVTKQDVLDEIAADTVELQDVVLGGGNEKRENRIKEIDRIIESSPYENRTLQKERDRLVAKRTVAPTHFSQYQEPGSIPGSYREMFVTAPNNAPVFNVEAGIMSEKFGSRLDAEAYIEKLKSAETATGKPLSGRIEIIELPTYDWQDGHSQFSGIQNPVVRIRFNTRETARGVTLFVEEVQGPSEANQAKMPEHLRKRIYDIGAKRVLSYAKEQGADGISWTTGTMQAGRYDLSKQVDELGWEKDGDKFNIFAWKGERELLNKKGLTADELEAHIGKDGANKIIRASNEPSATGGSLKGLDLRVGGEGLKRLYDSTLPTLFKKYGREPVSKIALFDEPAYEIEEEPSVGTFRVFNEKGEGRGNIATEEEAETIAAELNSKRAVEVPYVPITGKTPVVYPLYSRGGQSDRTITEAKVKAAFPGQHVDRVGDKFIVTLKNGLLVHVDKVDSITPNELALNVGYGRGLQEGETITGSYQRVLSKPENYGLIRLVKGRAGQWHLAHESVHLLEDFGVITSTDRNLLDLKIKYDGKWVDDLSGAENRANYLADEQNAPRYGTLVGRLWIKIGDFIDRIVNAFGVRTAAGVVRDVTTGDVFSRPPGAPIDAMSEQYSAGESIKRPLSKTDTRENVADIGNAIPSVFSRATYKHRYEPTPAEALNVQSAIEGRSVEEAVQFVIDTSPETSQRLVAGKVLDRIKDMQNAGVSFELRIAHNRDRVPQELKGMRGITYTEPEWKKVQVWLQGADVTGYVGTSYDTLLHETIHAATQAVIESGRLGNENVREVYSELRSVDRAIRNHLDSRRDARDITQLEKDIFWMEGGGNNFLSSEDEILAWGLSSKKFQEYLETIPYGSETLWTRFVNAIRSALGLKPNMNTALSGLLKAGESLFDNKQGYISPVKMDVINTRRGELLNASLSAQKPAETPVVFADTVAPITDQDYTEHRELSGAGKKFAPPAKGVGTDFAREAARLLVPISTRLARISPEISARVRALDKNTNTAIQNDLAAVLPLLKKAKTGMTRSDAADWAYARSNSDAEKINALVEKYGMQKEYAAARAMLDGLRDDAIDVGLGIGEINEYWTRKVKDLKGLYGEMELKERGVFTRALADKAASLGMNVEDLDPDMRATLIENIILGGPTGLGGADAAKSRKFQKVPPRLMQYYMHPDAAILHHIRQMRTAIEKRKFFGKIPEKVAEMRRQLYVAQAKTREWQEQYATPEAVYRRLLAEAKDDPKKMARLKEDDEEIVIEDIKEKARIKRNEWIGRELELRASIKKYALQRDYTDNIGPFIFEQIDNGKIDAADENELSEILKARFHERGTFGFWQAYKNFSYIDTMGSPISALTQIGDLAWSMYEGGLISGLKHAGRAIAGTSQITREDAGVSRIAEEFAESSQLGKALSWVFKHTGLEKIDAIGKEALLNAALEKYQKQATNDPRKLAGEIKHIFGAETGNTIQALQQGEITENVKMLVYSRLADFQPVGLSEMPERYLTSGNGRVFYMLKTFTIKQFDAFRREALSKIASGKTKGEKVEGLKNLIRLALFFVLANATADELKDWVLGRTTDFSDRVADNVLRLAGASKFVTWTARTEGAGTALAKQVLPPFKFIDSLTKDIYNAGDDKGLELTASIPLVGKLAYWHLGRGTTKRKDIWEIRLDKYRQKLSDVKEDFDQAPDKPAFLRDHRQEMAEYRRLNQFQGRINNYRKIINQLKSRPEQTDSAKKRIRQLEERRIEVIRIFLEKQGKQQQEEEY